MSDQDRTGTTTTFQLETIRHDIADFVSSGEAGNNLIDRIRIDSRFAPVECDILDYKREIGCTKLETAKVVEDIVAMYNTYGGVLVIGVEETLSEVVFEVVGVEYGSIDMHKMQGDILNFTGHSIPISLEYVKVSLDAGDLVVAVLYVPKNRGSKPLSYIKKGPHDKENRPIFIENDTPRRQYDRTIKAKGPQYFELLDERLYSYGTKRSVVSATRGISEHNLPDRAFVYSKFRGRTEIIDGLWEWLGDEYSRLKVLAGEGGLGKTSIAYKFATEVAERSEVGIEKILWLTAKSRKFDALKDVYTEAPETHFHDFRSLLERIAFEQTMMEQEVQELDDRELKQQIVENSKVISFLIFIDDVDSLNLENQRKVAELGFAFGSTKSRILLTTRNNFSFSSDVAVQVSGLEREEYQEFLNDVSLRIGVDTIKEKFADALYQASSGSPLFTESLMRLARSQGVMTAISTWKGMSGASVRAAAYEREIKQLSDEARLVLVSLALLKQASFIELSSVTGYIDDDLMAFIDELSSLYLVAAFGITDEPRYGVKSELRTYILANPSKLVSALPEIQKRAKALRETGAKVASRASSPFVGAAINQAMGFVKENNLDQAVETILSALKTEKNSPDLWTMNARLLLMDGSGRVSDARNSLLRARDLGASKTIFFDLFYEVEFRGKNFLSAIAICDEVIETDPISIVNWYEKRAEASIGLAALLRGASDHDRVRTELWEASSSLVKASKHAEREEKYRVRKGLQDTHDAIWQTLSQSSTDFDAIIESNDSVVRMLDAEDYRVAVFGYLCETLSRLVGHAARMSSGTVPSRLRNLIDQRLRTAKERLDRRIENSEDERLYRLHSDLMQEYSRFDRILGERD